MRLMFFDESFFVPILIFAIPIVAIVGGITAGIIKTLGQQRLVENAQRERIAAIERGIDPSKLPPLPALGALDDVPGALLSSYDYQRRRSQNLLIGGIVTLAAGIGVMAFLSTIETGDNVWAVGIIPAAVGVALVLSSWIVRPRGRDLGNGGTTPAR